jgi:hypothetical protein
VIECREALPVQGDVVNCFVGLRVCEAGAWGACLAESSAMELLGELEVNAGP